MGQLDWSAAAAWSRAQELGFAVPAAVRRRSRNANERSLPARATAQLACPALSRTCHASEVAR